MNKDYEYIDKFKAISIREVCKDLHLDPSNLYAHRMSNYHVHKIRIELEKRVNELNKKKDYRKIKGKRKRLKRKYENNK